MGHPVSSFARHTAIFHWQKCQRQRTNACRARLRLAKVTAASQAGLRGQISCLSKLTLQEEAHRALALRRIAFDDRAGKGLPKMKRVIEMSCAGLMAIALSVGVIAQVPQDRSSIDPLQALNASLG